VNPDTPVALSAIDRERFGIRVARAGGLTTANLSGVLAFCRSERVELLIARCPATDLAAAQALEAAGGRLMDTLVYYARDLRKPAIPEDTGTIPVRPVRPEETAAVRRVAAEAFRGYTGHYHADPRLDRRLCDLAYTSWAERSCTDRSVADEVYVADLDGAPVGFATLRMNHAAEGEGVLFAVAEAAQGKGIYRSFMIHGMRWCAGRGAERMVASTQLTNIAVQKVWVRVGFEPSHALFTFHAWFDQEGARA
jgi:GNAT superfamily N-acetyltransferase